MRLFNKNTEQSIIKRQGPHADTIASSQRGSFDDAVRDKAAVAAADNVAAALSLFEWHSQVTYRLLRVNDKRLNELNLRWSAGWWVLNFAGLLNDVPPRNAHFLEVRTQVLSLLANVHHLRSGTEEERR